MLSVSTGRHLLRFGLNSRVDVDLAFPCEGGKHQSVYYMDWAARRLDPELCIHDFREDRSRFDVHKPGCNWGAVLLGRSEGQAAKDCEQSELPGVRS